VELGYVGQYEPGCGLDDQGIVIRFLEWARYFLIIQSVRTAHGINLASCAVRTWDLCPLGEAAGV
jgi:hypothetical protein